MIVVVLYVSLFTLGNALVNLPLAVYQGYVLLQQFGLSTQTLGAWLRDDVLSLGIELAMMLVLFTGFYGLLALMPRRWPLGGGAAPGGSAPVVEQLVDAVNALKKRGG